MRPYTDLVKRLALLLGALALIGCASSGGSSQTGGYVSTTSRGGYQSIQFESSGRVFGENFDYMTTATGYRGVLREELATMESSDGERITGSRGGSIIDLHVEYEGASLRISGMFAGRLGRMVFDAGELTSTLWQLFDATGPATRAGVQRQARLQRRSHRPGGGAAARRDPPVATAPAGDAAGDAVLSVTPG